MTLESSQTHPETNILWGFMNIEGLKSHIEELLILMEKKGLSFLVLFETWLRPQQIFSHPAIVWDVRVPRPDGPGGRGIGGIMVIRNLRLTKAQDFNCLEIDHNSQAYMWFRFRSIIVGGFYLSPHAPLEMCMYKVLTAENYIQRFGQFSQVFLVGDLNMRLGVQEGDIMTNSRASLDTVLHQIGLRRLKPINDQYTFESHAVRSTIDHDYGNGLAHEYNASTQVYTESWIAASDHRLIICKARLTEGTNWSTYSHQWHGNVSLKVSRSSLRDKRNRSVALDTFKSLRLAVKQIVQIQLLPLYTTEGKLIAAQCQEALNMANEHVVDYIWTSLKSGGITRTPHRPATSRLFWTSEIRGIAKKRGWLLKQARSHPYGSTVATALLQRAKVVSQQLQAAIKKSKTESFLKFSEALHYKNQSNTLKLLCNARRRHLGLSKISPLRTE